MVSEIPDFDTLPLNPTGIPDARALVRHFTEVRP